MLLLWGELRPSPTQRRLGRSLHPYPVASRSIQPFGDNGYVPKIGRGGALFPGGAGSPSNAKSAGARPTSVPSRILILPFGHNRHGPKFGGAVPLSGESWVPIQHSGDWAEAYLRTKWHLDSSSCLATIEMGRKLGGSAPFWGRGLGLHLTQSPLD